ncbi:unnamed protein product [Lactuca saligna]|uniref:Uncharacterized protein n=1 Tax=Lactuca saligna TaxID=75948 RepID=A0AA35ZFT6_LACSI|nr:unnamed protein product [Lactuca saligna]
MLFLLGCEVKIFINLIAAIETKQMAPDPYAILESKPDTSQEKELAQHSPTVLIQPSLIYQNIWRHPDVSPKQYIHEAQTKRKMPGKISATLRAAEKSPVCPMQPLDGGQVCIQEENTSNFTPVSQASSSSTAETVATYIASL